MHANLQSTDHLNDFINKYQKVPVIEYPNNVINAIPDPVVSCRISTYQHAPYIRQCIEGVLMQKTSFPFEIVIGEDDSSDGTREICMEYAKMHPDRIRLFLHDRRNNISVNGKPSAKFQSSYTESKCRGMYTALCEGDDYWINSNKLALQIEHLLSDKSVILTGAQCRPFVVRDNVLGRAFPSMRSGKRFKEAKHEHILQMRFYMHTSTLVFRKDLLIWRDRISTIELVSGDLLLHVAAVLADCRVSIYNEVFSVYRISSTGVWTSRTKQEHYRNYINTWTHIYRVLQLNNSYRYAIIAYRNIGYFRVLIAVLSGGPYSLQVLASIPHYFLGAWQRLLKRVPI
jgi:glycosyltransferase involved in cell wall biosynthesis